METMVRAAQRLVRRRGASDDSGVSLLELVFASAILAVVSVSMLSALIFASTSGQQSTMRTRALDLANRTIEHARNLSYDNVGVVGGNPSGAIPAEDIASAPGFVIRTRVDYSFDPVTGRARYKNIKVVVTWTTPRSGVVSLASSIYGPTTLVNNGDLLVQVYEVGTTTGIEGAVVQVTPNGSTTPQSRSTGTDGKLVFGMLPIGTTAVSVSASGWVFAPVAPSPSVVPDVLTSQYVYGHRPCTVVVTAVSSVSTTTTISGVLVTVTGAGGQVYTGTTDVNGVATITGMLPDSYGVAATKVGYADASDSLSALAAGSTTPLTIAMSPAAPATAFKVRVVNTSGSAVPNATVTVTGPGTSTANVAGSPKTTGSNGEVFFTGLATGSYKVGVTATGYTAYAPTAYSVVGGTDQTLQVTLNSTSTSTKGTLVIQVWTYRGEGYPDTGHQMTVRVRNSSGTWTTINSSSGENHFHTDANGLVTLTSLTAGTYQVTVRDITAPQEDDVVGGQTTYLIFTTPR